MVRKSTVHIDARAIGRVEQVTRILICVYEMSQLTGLQHFVSLPGNAGSSNPRCHGHVSLGLRGQLGCTVEGGRWVCGTEQTELLTNVK